MSFLWSAHTQGLAPFGSLGSLRNPVRGAGAPRCQESPIPAMQAVCTPLLPRGSGELASAIWGHWDSCVCECHPPPRPRQAL